MKDYDDEYGDTETGAWVGYGVIAILILFVALLGWSAYFAVFG